MENFYNQYNHHIKFNDIIIDYLMDENFIEDFHFILFELMIK